MKRRMFLAGVASTALVSGILNGQTRWSRDAPKTSTIDQGPAVDLEVVATGFDQPLSFQRVSSLDLGYVADKTGRVEVLGPDGRLPDPLLTLDDEQLVRESWEQGLLGFVLHPEFEDTGKFYVRYSAPKRPGTPDEFTHTFVLSEFTATRNRTRTVAGSERTLLEIPQPGRNHNAGALAFGPDGYLYVGVGDGNSGGGDSGTGHADDWYLLNAGGNGQNLTQNLLGSILRIDVDRRTGERPYAIPSDNPLVGERGLDEQYAWGFRNPYRMSFDGEDLLVGDVGEDQFEEVNLVRRGGNYGWNVREGTRCYGNRLTVRAITWVTSIDRSYPACPRTTRSGAPLVDPVIAYPHIRDGEHFGRAVIGGYRCRDERVPVLHDRYVFGDVNGTVLAATPTDQDGEMWDVEVLTLSTPGSEPFGESILSFGQDDDGLYLLTSRFRPGSGRVYRFTQPDS